MNKDQCSMAGDVILDHEPVLPTTVSADGTFTCRRCGQAIKWDPVLKKNILASEPLTEGKDFLLTISMKIKAADSEAARREAGSLLETAGLKDPCSGQYRQFGSGEQTIKLQEIWKDGPPTKIGL